MQNILIGKITSAHGIKGSVKIVSFTAVSKDIAKYSGKIFDKNNREYKIKILNEIPNKDGNLLTVQIDGVADRNAAEALRNTDLFINRSDFKKAKKDEFYQVDLIGLKVLDKQNKQIGIVEEITDFGAGTNIEIKFSDEKYNKNQITNFSFTNEIFPEVNVEEGYLVIDIPEVVEIKDSGNKN